MDDANGELRQQVAALTERLIALEAQVARLSSPNGSAGASPAPARVAAPRQRRRLPAFATRSSEGRTLENRIGSQLFNRIGFIALLAGVGWFFKFAVDNGWLGPLMRIVLGLAMGSAVVVWSERFRRRNYAGFSYTLKAVGTGVLYLTPWAAFSLYQLVPAGVAFAGMVLVTLLNAWLALIEDTELLAFYALAGGLATPLLLSTGVDHEIFLFSYLLLLNAAMFVLIARRPWTRLMAAAYPATVFYAVGWYVEHYDPTKRGVTLLFAACFWILFAAVPPLLERFHGERVVPLQQPNTLSVVLPMVHGAIAFCFLCVLLRSDAKLTDAFEAQAWTALIFSATYLCLMLVAQKGRENPLRVAASATLAVAFVTLFIPLYFSGRPIVYGWLVEAVLMVLLLRRLPIAFAPALAAAPLMLAFCDLLLYDSFKYGVPPDQTVLINARFACFVAAIVAFAGSALLARGWEGWARFSAGAVLAVNVLAVLAVSREIETYWQGSPTFFAERFSYSIWFMIYGAALLLVGFWRDSAFLRWQALVLLAFTIAKVFLYDMANLSQGYRVLSLLGLGTLLLSVSFAYQRDWLRLRGNA